MRLAQMVGNLLHNAGRFTGRGGRVEVRTEVDPTQQMATVVVTDSGVGIEDELLARLFDPFSQAHQDIARSKGGLGLGLALTSGLARLHGGGVTAHSRGKNLGSTFVVHIPLCAVQADTFDASDGNGHGVERLRILVVEDNRDAAETLRDLLELGGHDVTVAYDGSSALEAFRQVRPTVVISDLGLPGEVDGYGVGRGIRALPDSEGVYLIALSGYANEEARKRSRDAGFDAHFAKPPDIARLEQLLSDVASRRNLHGPPPELGELRPPPPGQALVPDGVSAPPRGRA